MAQTSGLSADRAPRSRGLHPEEHGGVDVAALVAGAGERA